MLISRLRAGLEGSKQLGAGSGVQQVWWTNLKFGDQHSHERLCIRVCKCIGVRACLNVRTNEGAGAIAIVGVQVRSCVGVWVQPCWHRALATSTCYTACLY